MSRELVECASCSSGSSSGAIESQKDAVTPSILFVLFSIFYFAASLNQLMSPKLFIKLQLES